MYFLFYHNFPHHPLKDNGEHRHIIARYQYNNFVYSISIDPANNHKNHNLQKDLFLNIPSMRFRSNNFPNL